MWRILKDLGVTLRELVYALLGQPSRSGPTRDEAENNRAQHEQLAASAPASAREAATQVAREVGKAAIWQPTERARRKR